MQIKIKIVLVATLLMLFSTSAFAMRPPVYPTLCDVSELGCLRNFINRHALAEINELIFIRMNISGDIYLVRRTQSYPIIEREATDEDLADGPCDAGCPDSPILIDMGQDGIRLGASGVGVEFDITAVGYPSMYQWVSPNSNDTFLALDINQNGLIDDGSELFGEGTALILEPGVKAENGYVALAQYDIPTLGGDGDEYITEADTIWNDLLLWNDLNANGLTDAGELSNLSDSGLTDLDITPVESRKRDHAGNEFRFWSWAKNLNQQGNKKYRMVDVFFLPIQ